MGAGYGNSPRFCAYISRPNNETLFGRVSEPSLRYADVVIAAYKRCTDTGTLSYPDLDGPFPSLRVFSAISDR